MQATLAQTLALVMHGNAFLQGRDLGPFWPEATFFNFCRSVRFLEVPEGRIGDPVLVGADPLEWLHSLRGRCDGLRTRIFAGNDPAFGAMMTAGFVGGGSRWLIEEVGGEAPRFWSHQWSVTDSEAEDRRIWSVTYWGIDAFPATRSTAPADLDLSERELDGAFEAIAAFAGRIGSHFSGIFERALRFLRGDETGAPPYYPDLAPPGHLSPQARRLLTACQIGWVFGGMGSWNDGAYGGKDCEEGEALSHRLFTALEAALAVVANSTAPGGSAVLSPSPSPPSDR